MNQTLKETARALFQFWFVDFDPIRAKMDGHWRRCHSLLGMPADLYGLTRKDAAYILDTSPTVRRQDKAAFGHYRTKAMVLAYYNALAAGDTSTDVAV